MKACKRASVRGSWAGHATHCSSSFLQFDELLVLVEKRRVAEGSLRPLEQLHWRQGREHLDDILWKKLRVVF
eukprot:SAG31_NODE_206_length_20335_cov_17.910160_21_plen_72_part_00